MKIGIARLYVKNANPEYNFSNVDRLYRQAIEENLEIIIFPRLCIGGFSVDDNFSDDNYLQKLFEYLEKIVSLTAGEKTDANL
ncbi:hypothetical protein FACS1894152_2610 [Bacilli bacterium]|nr:hypothetical protein FACS1894152_2610 [Bacilli bacterium]